MTNPYLTSPDAYHHAKSEDRSELFGNVLKLSAAGVGAVVAKNIYEGIKGNPTNRLWEAVLSNATDDVYAGDELSRILGSKYKRSLFVKSINTSLAIEEASPFHILRALQVTNVMQSVRSASSSEGFRLRGYDVQLQEDYYRKLLEKHGRRKLILNDLKYGFAIHNEKMYAVNKHGNLSKEPVLDYAKAVTLQNDVGGGHVSNPSNESGYHPGLNKMFQKMRNIVGVTDNNSLLSAAFGTEDSFVPRVKMGIIGASSKAQFNIDVARSYSRLSIEGGLKVIDNVAGFIEEWLDSSPLKDSKTWGKMKKRMQTNLGTAGDYSLGVRESILTTMKNSGKKFGIAAAGFYLLNNVAQILAPSSSAYDKGIVEGLATNATNLHVRYAELVSDRFQKMKEDQEEAAPGSTSLTRLAGFPMAGFTLGGTISYLQRQGDAAVNTTAESLSRATEEKPLGFKLDSVLSERMSRARRFGMYGAAVGALVALPFLPGALVGKSSQELKDEYSGKTDVPIKAGRWWFSGSYEYEGTKTKYFTKGWYARLMSGAENKVKYGENDPDDFSPIFSPLRYLSDPYRFEKLHEKDMPYPVWGMDVNFGSFIGKMFEKTIGQIIKPDRISPDFQRLIDSQKTANYIPSDGTSPSEPGYGPETSHLQTGIIQPANKPSFLSDFVDIPVDVSRSEAELISSGLMLPQQSPMYTPNREGLRAVYNSVLDFSGIKGWAFGLMEQAVGLDIGEQPLQLARSGEATSSGKEIEDLNLGGIFGFGEAQRRIINTSSATMYERANPLQNTMPSWLPGDDSQYYVNFRKGNPYRAIENAYVRLPGVGYSAIHKELEGVNPEDYPDIYKYKILADVAIGSREYYDYKNKIERRVSDGQASQREVEMYQEIERQSADRSILKTFDEYEDARLSARSPISAARSGLWNFISHNAENPLESLTFFRPAGKLIHARTAIEDYKRTQLLGNDVGIWTNPYSHFIKPTINQLTDAVVPGSFKPDEAQERQNVNEYFDKLGYLKWRNTYKQAMEEGDTALATYAKSKYRGTTIGSIASGLDQTNEMAKAYSSLESREKPYFNSFSREEDPGRRAQILAMESETVGNMYRQIWSNLDYAKKYGGDDPYQVLAERDRMQQQALLQESEIQNLYNKEVEIAGTANAKEIAADIIAEQHIQRTTGIPGQDFVGWNPALDVKDIKLKTLMVGEDDVREYGFWENDENRIRRMIGLDDATEITGQLDRIKEGMMSFRKEEARYMSVMRSNGYAVDRVRETSGKGNNINVNVYQ